MHYLKNKCIKSQAECGCLRLLLLLLSASVGTAICPCPLVCPLLILRGDSPGRGALRPRPGCRAGLETLSPEAARARACVQGPCGRGDQDAPFGSIWEKGSAPAPVELSGVLRVGVPHHPRKDSVFPPPACNTGKTRPQPMLRFHLQNEAFLKEDTCVPGVKVGDWVAPPIPRTSTVMGSTLLAHLPRSRRPESPPRWWCCGRPPWAPFPHPAPRLPRWGVPRHTCAGVGTSASPAPCVPRRPSRPPPLAPSPPLSRDRTPTPRAAPVNRLPRAKAGALFNAAPQLLPDL
ncbi:uncharacterized protein LOC118152940 [Callithrix jacchus]